jgi:demethylmenaquinone methyltransferase/2-methoxy-6-polyprenyl-1,4-benzoquinol methylase
MKNWYNIETALEEIIDDYERMNHVISMFQDEKVRFQGLKKVGKQKGIALELGSGPGNFTKLLKPNIEGTLICLDYSERMLSVAQDRIKLTDISFIRGVFEALPFREDTISFIGSAYALRDSSDKIKALQEVGRILRRGSRLLVIDIGKPDKPIIRVSLSFYLKHFVPVIGGLATRYRFRNPWSLLHETYKALPINQNLKRAMEDIIGATDLQELYLGCIIIAIAQKA